MTAILKRRPGKGGWKTSSIGPSGKKIVVAVEPLCCVVREKGTHTELRIGWDRIFLMAAQMEAAMIAKRKKQEKEEKKRLNGKPFKVRARSVRRGVIRL